MNEGWIKLHRKLLDGGMLSNPTVLQVWIYLLLRAAHKPQKVMVGFQEILLLPGQIITGRKSAAKTLKISEKNFRTAIKFLEKHEKVAIKPTNKFSIISIIKWDVYQGQEDESGQQNGQHVASKWPASGQQVATYKNERMKEENPSFRTPLFSSPPIPIENNIVVGQNFGTEKNAQSPPNCKNSDSKNSKTFKIPSMEEITNYCIERKNSVDPEKFYDYYQSNGWKVGKNPMKDWRAAIRTWEKSSFNEPKKSEQQQGGWKPYDGT